MTAFGSRPTNDERCLQNDSGLFVMLREYGCPMMDDTQWDQDESGELFSLMDATEVNAYWLPCTSHTAPPVLPGTCDACVWYRVRKAAEGRSGY